MKRLLIVLPLALAACHSKPTTVAENATANQVDAALAANGEGMKLSPGHWDMTGAVTDIQAPGLPPQALAAMRQQMASQHPHSSKCLTPEQAAKPAGSFFTSGNSASCTYDHFAMSGGKLDVAQTCHAAGSTQHTTIVGTYSSDTMHLDVTTSGQGGGGSPAGGMSVKATMDGKHSGACTGQEEAS